VREQAKTARGILLSLMAYFLTVLGILSVYGYEINLRELSTLVKSAAFLTGLGVSICSTVFLTVTSKRMQKRIEPKRILGGILRAVPFALLVIGAIFIFLSYRTDLWNNGIFNPSVLGAGVSVMAIGVAFLFAVYPRMGGYESVTGLTNRIETLNAKFNRLEKVIDCFLDESQKLANRINQVAGEKRDKRKVVKS